MKWDLSKCDVVEDREFEPPGDGNGFQPPVAAAPHSHISYKIALILALTGVGALQLLFSGGISRSNKFVPQQCFVSQVERLMFSRTKLKLGSVSRGWGNNIEIFGESWLSIWVKLILTIIALKEILLKSNDDDLFFAKFHRSWLNVRCQSKLMDWCTYVLISTIEIGRFFQEFDKPSFQGYFVVFDNERL